MLNRFEVSKRSYARRAIRPLASPDGQPGDSRDERGPVSTPLRITNHTLFLGILVAVTRISFELELLLDLNLLELPLSLRQPPAQRSMRAYPRAKCPQGGHVTRASARMRKRSNPQKEKRIQRARACVCA
jgi:hypothetical protein